MVGRLGPAIPRDLKRTCAMPDTASPSPLPPLLQSFDEPLGRNIIELHVWAVGEGLRGTEVAPLFSFIRELAGASASGAALAIRKAAVHAIPRHLDLTVGQVGDGVTKHSGVVATLNRTYWGVSEGSAHRVLLDSWGKG